MKTRINLWHPINGKWFNIIQYKDLETSQYTFYTNGVLEEDYFIGNPIKEPTLLEKNDDIQTP